MQLKWLETGLGVVRGYRIKVNLWISTFEGLGIMGFESLQLIRYCLLYSARAIYQ